MLSMHGPRVINEHDNVEQGNLAKINSDRYRQLPSCCDLMYSSSLHDLVGNSIDVERTLRLYKTL